MTGPSRRPTSSSVTDRTGHECLYTFTIKSDGLVAFQEQSSRHAHAPMNIKSVLLCLHAASTVLAFSIFGLAHLMLGQSTYPTLGTAVVASSVTTFAGVGFLAGLAAMAGRQAKSESALLAVSTVAAFLLLIASAYRLSS